MFLALVFVRKFRFRITCGLKSRVPCGLEGLLIAAKLTLHKKEESDFVFVLDKCVV